MRHLKRFKLNETLSHKELAEELKGAKNIEVSFISADKSWGVEYYKDNVKKSEGGFKTNNDVHYFLIDMGIDYGGKEGFLMLKKIRDKQISEVPFGEYQQVLLRRGLEGLFDLD